MTDLIFRMEQLDEGFVGSTWTESQAMHDSPAPATDDDQRRAAGGHRRHGDATRSSSRSAIAASASAATTLPLRQRQEVQELLHAQEDGARR